MSKGHTVKHKGDVDLANYVIGKVLQRTGTAPVFTDGSFFKYEQTGLWRVWPEHEVVKTVLSLHRKLTRVSNHTASRTVDNMRVLCADPNFFKATEHPGVAFKNGFVRLEANALKKYRHAPEHKARFGYDFRYVKDAQPEKTLRFLGQVFGPDHDKDDKIAFLQEFIGACLFGLAPRFERAVVLFGREGRNGKSILLEIIASLFPTEARAAVAPQKWGEEYYAAELIAARVNAVSEIPKTAISNGTLFKAVISGDEIVGRPIRAAPIKFRPQAGHVFAGNYLPAAGDVGPAFWRRWTILTFNRTFSGEQNKHEMVKNMLAETPAVVSWAAQGALRLFQQGHYTIPPSSEEAIASWSLKADQVKAFLQECTKTDSKPRATVREAYDSYKSWSLRSGHALLSKSTFNERLEQLGYEVKRGKTSNLYNFAIKDKTTWGDNSKSSNLIAL